MLAQDRTGLSGKRTESQATKFGYGKLATRDSRQKSDAEAKLVRIFRCKDRPRLR